MGRRPAKTKAQSIDIILYPLIILKANPLCDERSFFLILKLSKASENTDDPYNSRGSIAFLYIILMLEPFKPQVVWHAIPNLVRSLLALAVT